MLSAAHWARPVPFVVAAGAPLRTTGSNSLASNNNTASETQPRVGGLRHGTALATGAPLTLCAFVAVPDVTSMTLGSKHAMWFYTEGPGRTDMDRVRILYGQNPDHGMQQQVLLSDFTWRMKFLGDGSFTHANYARAWVLDGGDCDGLVAPGYSFLALSMSPLVNGAKTAWVDPVSAHAALSDKHIHPSFNRVFPSTAAIARAMVAFLSRLGWRDANVLTVDDAYAQALSTDFVAAMDGAGATVHFTRTLTVPEVVPFAAAMRAIDSMSPSRLVILTGFANPAMTAMLHHIAAMGYEERFVFIFPFLCPSADSTVEYRLLRSAFCFDVDHSSGGTAFEASYRGRNASEDEALVKSFPYAVADRLNVTDFWSIAALGHDAALHAMRALAYARRARPATLAAAVRTVETAGLTGPVRLDAAGDRIEAFLAFRNARGNASGAAADVPVARVSTAGDVLFEAPDGSPTAGNARPPLVLLGATYGAGAALPAVRRPDADAGGGGRDVLVVALVGAVGGVVLVLAAALLYAFCCTTAFAGARDNSNAPKDADRPFAIVFTDIQASTALWAQVPEQMSAAVDQHHAVVRRVIARHRGYEVKTIGDAFMVAFQEPHEAVAFGLGVQRALHEASWDAAIDDVYGLELAAAAATAAAAVGAGRPGARGDATSTAAAAVGGACWNGLRVRVGVHHGLGKVQVDPVSRGYDYYGTVVNTAARVEAVGHGGQVLVTGATWAIAGEHRAVATALGAQRLRGLEAPLELVQLVPPALSARRFPPLRLGVDVDLSVHEKTTYTSEGPEDESLVLTVSGSRSPHCTSPHTGDDGLPGLNQRRVSMSMSMSNSTFDVEVAAIAARVVALRDHRAAARASIPPSPTGPDDVRAPARGGGEIASRHGPTSPPTPPTLDAVGRERRMGQLSSSIGRDPHDVTLSPTGLESRVELPEDQAPAPPIPVPHADSPPPRPSAPAPGPPQLALPLSVPSPALSPLQSPPMSVGPHGHAEESTHTAPVLDTDVASLVLLASFLRRLLSVVPPRERKAAVEQLTRRWHVKAFTASQVRPLKRTEESSSGHDAEERYKAEVAEARTAMAVVERVWLSMLTPPKVPSL